MSKTKKDTYPSWWGLNTKRFEDPHNTKEFVEELIGEPVMSLQDGMDSKIGVVIDVVDNLKARGDTAKLRVPVLRVLVKEKGDYKVEVYFPDEVHHIVDVRQHQVSHIFDLYDKARDYSKTGARKASI